MCIQITNQRCQEELKSILKANSISEASIAKKMGMTPQAFNYQLNISTNFSIGFYEEVKSLLRKEGFIKEPSKAWKDLNNSTREIEVSLFHSLELLNLKVSQVGEDDRFTHEEKPEVIAVLKTIRANINFKIDRMIKEIEQ